MFTIDIRALDAAVVVAVLFIFYRARAAYQARKNGPLPPGPKGWPILGCIDMPVDYYWLKYAELGQTYGGILSFTILGRYFIVINDRKYITEMFEKRYQNYGERGDFEMITKLVGWDQLTVLMPANDLWKQHRRNYSRLFGTRTLMQQFHPVQVLETRRLMRAILHEPDKLDDHVRYWGGAMILKIVYGHDIKPGKDPLVEVVDEAMEQFSILSRPGAYLVDSLPFLRYIPSWFPGGGFKKEVKYYRKTLQDMVNMPFEITKANMEKGIASPSYVSNLLNADDYTPDQEYGVKTSAATVYAGGADTTSTTVYGFFLLMLLWPDKQKKAQEEIERVVGKDRLPTFDDRENLPYTEAVMKECMRLFTSVPLSGPRRALNDDVVDGYFIPKNALIVPNVWQFLHDPEIYDDPMNFVPERWLVNSPPPHPREIIFGFGRRICPGMIVADTSFFIAAVTTLALLDIKATKESPTAFTQGEGGVVDGQPISHPKPFKCKITPRSAKAEALIAAIDHELA